MPKKPRSFKKVIAGAVVATTLGIGFWASQAFYTVKQIVDGDTFVTSTNQYVRLDSVNAPESDGCLGDQAKAELSKLILNKRVFIKVTYVDNFRRLVGSVYTTNGNVGQKMLQKGLATFETKSTQNQSALLKTAQDARQKGIGVYSSTCTQSVNSQNQNCNIKGNTTGAQNFYRSPNCGLYSQTLVQLHYGDKWFCTEKEAIKAGFKKGGDCP